MTMRSSIILPANAILNSSTSFLTATTSPAIRIRRKLNVVVDFASTYNDWITSQPLITKSVTSAIILGLADATAQTIELRQLRKQQILASEQSPLVEPPTRSSSDLEFSISRVARFSSLGLLLIGPWNHYYYKVLDAAIPSDLDNPWTLANLGKVAIDQGLQAPFFTVFIILYLNYFSTFNLTTAVTNLKQQYVTTILDNWKLWIPATALNFALIPGDYRVLYLNCVFFFWSIYLSVMIQPPTNENEE